MRHHSGITTILILLFPLLMQAQNGQWVEQPTEIPLRGMMGIAMADTGNGYAVGDVNVLKHFTGVLLKRQGDPTWRPVPPSAFVPALNIALASWAQDVWAIPNTGIAFISWRDDYRSLVYKTYNYGRSWVSVSPLNPILYGTRFAIEFKDNSEGMIVGEGPGRVHRTLDGGVTWTNYTIPIYAALSDVEYANPYWFVSAGQNALYRYNPALDRWDNLSFTTSVHYFLNHLKIDFIDSDHGYAHGFNYNNSSHLLVTHDGGGTWDPVPVQPGFARSPDGFKGLFFFSKYRGWVASGYDELAFTPDGGCTWKKFQPQVFGGKAYGPVNKLFFLNESLGWAAGGPQRNNNYPSISHGYILKWIGVDKADISGTATEWTFDSLRCAESSIVGIPVKNTGSGLLSIEDNGITFNMPEFSLPGIKYPIIIQPFSEHIVQVRWRPGPDFYGPMPDSARMIISSTDVDHFPWIVKLTGERILSRLVPQIPTLTFPEKCLGDTAVAILPVSLFGNISPVITGMDVFTDRSTIELDGFVPGSLLQPGSELRFVLRSRRAGFAGGVIMLKTGLPDCIEEISIPFSGFFNSNNLTVSPAELDFGDVCVGSEAVAYIELKNSGTQDGRVDASEFVYGDNVFDIRIDTAESIGVGTSVVLPVRFRPVAADSNAFEGHYRYISGPCPDTLELTIRGRAIEAGIVVNPDSLISFAPVPIGKQISRVVDVENNGFLPLTISRIELRHAVQGLALTGLPSLPGVFDSGAKFSLQLQYFMSRIDSGKTELCLYWDDPCPDSLCIPVVLRSDELPVIEVAENLDFGTQFCGDPTRDSIALYNSGLDDLVVSSLSIEGPNASQFTVHAPPWPFTVAPGERVFIRMSYRSFSNGSGSAELLIEHNDFSVGGESRVRLTGERQVLELTILGDTLSAMRACLDGSLTRTFSLFNPGTSPLQLTGIALLGGSPRFRLRHGAIPAVVQPGKSFILNVDFQPDQQAGVNARILISSDPCDSKRMIRLRGTPLNADLVVTPANIDFGILSVTDTSVFTVTLRNNNTLDVLIDSLLLRGLGGWMFIEQKPALPLLLTPGQSLVLRLRLRDLKSGGQVRGALCVHLNAPCDESLCFPVKAEFEEGSLTAIEDSLLLRFEDCDSLLCDTLRFVNPLTETQRLSLYVSNPSVFSILNPSPPEAVLEAGDTLVVIICARGGFGYRAAGELLVTSDKGPQTAVAVTAILERSTLLFPDTLDFANLGYCRDERTLDLMLVNGGSMEQTITEIRISGSAFSSQAATPVRIDTGAAARIPIRFAAASEGVFPGSVEIVSRGRRCSRAQTIALRGEKSRVVAAFEPNTLIFANVVVGSSLTRLLKLENLNLPGMNVAGISVRPSALFSSTSTLPAALAVGETLDIPVRFRPQQTGTFFGALCVILDAPCADTICIVMEGTAVEGDLIFAAPELRFDTLAQCRLVQKPAILGNRGSRPVELSGSSIAGPGAAAFTILNPVSGAEQLPGGGERSFDIVLDASGLTEGAVSVSLFVTTDDPVQNVVELPLFAQRVTQVVRQNASLPYGPLVKGNTVRAALRLDNNGSAAITYTSALLPPQFSIATALPLRIPAGETADVDIDYLPTIAGVVQKRLVLHVTDQCRDSTVFDVTATVFEGLSQSDANLGEVPWCSTAGGIVVLTNNQQRDAMVESWRITGADSAYFSLLSPPVMPAVLVPSSSLQFSVFFQPDPGRNGPYGAEFVSTVSTDGDRIAMRSALRADVISGALDFQSPVDFGSMVPGSPSPDRIFIGRNLTSIAVAVSDLQVSNPVFELLGASPPLPAVIDAGDSLLVTMRFTPDRPGEITGQLLANYTEPCETDGAVDLRGTGSDDLLDVMLAVPQLSGRLDDTVTIPIYVEPDPGALNITSWSGSLRFNRSMLYPLEVLTAGTLSEDMEAELQYDYAAGEVSLSARGNVLRTGSEPLVMIKALVLLGDDVHSDLIPADFVFSNPVFRVLSCQNGAFTLEGYCNPDGKRLLSIATPSLLRQNSPNPVVTSTEIVYEIGEDNFVELALFDAMGRNVATLVKQWQPAGRYRTSFHVAALPPGRYWYTLRSGSFTASRSMLIIR